MPLARDALKRMNGTDNKEKQPKRNHFRDCVVIRSSSASSSDAISFEFHAQEATEQRGPPSAETAEVKCLRERSHFSISFKFIRQIKYELIIITFTMTNLERFVSVAPSSVHFPFAAAEDSSNSR